MEKIISMLDELLDEVEHNSDADMKVFLTTLQTLKSLVKVNNLLEEDEEDIISYITSQSFLTHEYFKEYRVSNNREMFSIDSISAQNTINEIGFKYASVLWADDLLSYKNHKGDQTLPKNKEFTSLIINTVTMNHVLINSASDQQTLIHRSKLEIN